MNIAYLFSIFVGAHSTTNTTLAMRKWSIVLCVCRQAPTHPSAIFGGRCGTITQQILWTYLTHIRVFGRSCCLRDSCFITNYHILEPKFTDIYHTTDWTYHAKLIYISCSIRFKRRIFFETFYGLRATCFFVTDYHVLEPNFTGTCNTNWYVITCICVSLVT